MYRVPVRIACRGSRIFFRKNIVAFHKLHAFTESTNFMRDGASFTKPKTENELCALNNDPDTFGSLDDEKDVNEMLDKLPAEEDDVVVHEVLDEKGNRKTRNVRYYTAMINKLLRQKKIADALDILETTMKKDRVVGDYYLYNILIKACGQVGYTRKAFSLFNQMIVYGVKPTAGTYTALFNGCANSPFPDDNLKRIDHLRQMMIEKNVPPNKINYNAMMKAYGRNGDIRNAFNVADEMMTKGFTLDDETFTFLFQACISQPDSGLRHALIVWHKMFAKKVKRTVFHFNLMLRCIRDCTLGDMKETQQVIFKLMETPVYITDKKYLDTRSAEKARMAGHIKDEKQSAFESDSKTDAVIVTSNNFAVQNATDLEPGKENRPNLLCRNPQLGNIISLSEIVKAEDRLLLFGGYSGFLNEMDAQGVEPDIKTFTMLLEIMPSTLAAEKDLLNEMKKRKLETDIDFCNMLIKKRSMRFDYENAKDVIRMIQSLYLSPDIVTFGVLSLGCKSISDACSLMEDMKQYGYGLNMEILGAMLKQGCAHFYFEYVAFIMRLAKRKNVAANKIFLQHLEKLDSASKKIIRELRVKKVADKKLPRKSIRFMEEYRMFKDYYKQWLTEIQKEEFKHPWKQFKKVKEKEVKEG